MNGCVFSWRIDCVFLCGNVKSHSCSHCRILIVIFWMSNSYCLNANNQINSYSFRTACFYKKIPKTTITLQLLCGGGLHFFFKVNKRMIVSNLWSTYVIESIQSDYCRETVNSTNANLLDLFFSFIMKWKRAHTLFLHSIEVSNNSWILLLSINLNKPIRW